MDAQTLIKSSMRVAKTLRRGFTPSAESMSDGLEALNMILGSLSASGMMIPSRTRENFTPSSAAVSFTIGSGADFNTARPMRIDEIFLRDSGGTDYYLEQIQQAEYDRIVDKDVDSIPARFFYNPAYANGVIYFDTKLSTSYDVYISSWKELTQLAGLTTTISLPNEYLMLLKYELADDLAMESGKQLTQGAYRKLNLARAAVRNINSTNNIPQMTTDLSSGGRFNIFADR